MKRLVLLSAILLTLAVPMAARADVSTGAALSVSVRPGSWADVVKAPDGFRFVRATATMVVTERPDGALTWQSPIPEPILYLRAAVDDAGTVEAIAQGNNSGDAYVIRSSGVTSLGQSFGQNATAIAWFPARGWAYYVQTSPSTYLVTEPAGPCSTPCLVSMPATSQGFRDIQPDGTVRRGDDYFTGPFNGRQLWEYAQRGAVTVGQCDPAAICAAVDGRTFTILSGFGFEPHLALDGRTFAVAVRAAGGAALVIVEPPYPAADGVLVPPSPAPPIPAPAPPAGGMPNHRADLAALRAQYGPTLTQAQAGEMMGRLAFKLRGEGFGLLRKDGGNNCPVNGLSVRVSCDWILHAPTNTGCDVLGSGPDAVNPGPSTVSWCDGDPSPDPARFLPVTTDPGAANTATGAPAPTPAPTSPAGITRVELDAAIHAAIVQLHTDLWNEVEAADSVLRGRLERLESGTPLDLVALQSAIDAALANYEVTGKTERDKLGLQHVVKLGISRRKQ